MFSLRLQRQSQNCVYEMNHKGNDGGRGGGRGNGGLQIFHLIRQHSQQKKCQRSQCSQTEGFAS